MSIQQLDFTDICARRHGGVATSVAANRSIAGEKVGLRRMVLNCLTRYHLDGATCEEVEFVCGLSHQTASARISELLRDGLITIRGQRPTSSGRMARVYFVTQKGAQ